MKITLLLFLSYITILLPSFLFGQELEPLETGGDKYLPNAYNNKKTSPAYFSYNASTRNTSIYTVQVNVDSNGQNIIGDAANEPNIAVNPLDENQIVIGWRQFDNVSSYFRQAGWSYTTDGGQTWTFPGAIEPGVERSDPVLDFDANGNFYYNSVLVDDFTCKVFKSVDGGASWDIGTDAHGGDKTWITIDRTEGIGKGNIYSYWGGFTRSTDGGISYEDPSYFEGGFYSSMSVGNNGELYVCGSLNGFGLRVTKSINAEDPNSMVSWDTPHFAYLDGKIVTGSAINNGLLGQANIDVDRSNGPGNGNVYVSASVNRISSNGDSADVMFAKSTDGGVTWNSPIRVNDDSSIKNIQWFGTMSVAPNGRIDVIWLDTRDAPLQSPHLSSLYYSYSIDQGETWSPNEKLSDSFNPHIGYPGGGPGNKMGDYFDMISDDEGAHLAWANTFNGEEDVYYSRIIPETIIGINDVSNDSIISIFPNPSNGRFTIISSQKQFQIEIYNTLYEKVYSNSIFQSKSEINISSQPAGIYLLKIINRNGSVLVRKLVQE